MVTGQSSRTQGETFCSKMKVSMANPNTPSEEWLANIAKIISVTQSEGFLVGTSAI